MAVVTFYDPIAKQDISYYLSEKLEPKWKAISQMVINKNKDRVYVVFGMEREGKSFWVFQQAKYIDPTFDISRICFTPEQFLEQIRTAPPGCVVVFDEAFRGFSSKSALSKVNKMLVQAMMEVGRKNLIIFIVLPSFSLLENYIAIHRSHALFQIYERKNYLYRGWRCYNRKKKAQIYYKSKKNYGIVPYTHTKIKGKFFAKKVDINNKKTYVPYETFDILAYDNKKAKSFGSKAIQEQETSSEIESRAFKYLISIQKYPITGVKEHSKWLEVNESTMRKWKRYEEEWKLWEKMKRKEGIYNI